MSADGAVVREAASQASDPVLNGRLDASRNAVLRRLPVAERARLEAFAEPAALRVETPVLEPGQPIERLILLDCGFVSLLAGPDDADGVEVGMIGAESAVGFPAALGLLRSTQRVVAQQGCRGHSLPISVLRDPALPELRRLLTRCAMIMVRQLEGAAHANARGRLAQRLARWLLMAHDRVEGDTLQVVHRFLSQMLGVRRAGVTEALHMLEGERLIRAERGCVVIRDRAGLIRAADGFYGPSETEFADLLDG